MRLRSVVEVVSDFRQARNNSLVARILRVQHAQRIRLGAPLVVLRHLVLHRSQRLAQSRDIARPIRRRPDRVEHQIPARDAQLVKKARQHLNHLGIAQRRFRSGTGRTNDFRADLPELAIAPFLRPFAAKLRADVIQLPQQPGFAHLVLDVSTDNAGSILRAESEGLGGVKEVTFEKLNCDTTPLNP